MHEIQLHDAEAALSAIIDKARHGEPSVVARHGKPEAMVLSFDESKRLSPVPSFGCLLMGVPFEEGDVPVRNAMPIREADI